MEKESEFTMRYLYASSYFRARKINIIFKPQI